VKVLYRQTANDDIVRQFRYYLLTAEAPEIVLEARVKTCIHGDLGPKKLRNRTARRTRGDELLNTRAETASDGCCRKYSYTDQKDPSAANKSPNAPPARISADKKIP
jgi:hypothetical protein